MVFHLDRVSLHLRNLAPGAPLHNAADWPLALAITPA
jgi:hypothetical protein